jgi:hypothetical protein
VGGTATTGCPPNRGPKWKHESPDFSHGENQVERKFSVQIDHFFENEPHVAGVFLVAHTYLRGP